MIDETIILLIYYYHAEEANHWLLSNIIKNYCGIYLPFDRYLGEPLKETFSRVIIYDYLKRRAEIGVKALNEEIITLAREEHPKYVLWTSWQYDIQPATLKRIREEGTVVVGWFFDDEWRFDDYSRWWIPCLDYCVTNDVTAVSRYKELGARAIQTIPNTGIAVNVDWTNLEEQYDVSFVGSKSTNREQYINELKENNIPVQVFGEGWGGYVSFEEMLDIFSTSRINLNFSSTYYATLGIKGRIFQICLAGGFLLTEYVPGIEAYFEIDREIICFHSRQEMMDKIAYYLAHEVERKAIARAGWEKATREYSSTHMVAKVFNQIERGVATRGEEAIADTTKLKMPVWTRVIPSQYHFQWGRWLMEESYQDGLWQDSLALSLWYNPLNIWAWYYRVIGLLPPFLRRAGFRLYGALERLPAALYYWLGSVPGLRQMLRQGWAKKVILHLKP